MTVYTSDFKPKDDWKIKRRTNTRIGAPIGYKADPTDLTIWIPDHEQIFWIEQAFDAKDNDSFSYRAGAEWVSLKTGRTISHSGFRDNWKLHRAKTTKSLVYKASKRRKRALTPIEKKKQELNRKIGKNRFSTEVAKKKLESIAEYQAKKEITVDLFDDDKPIDPFEGKEVAFKPNLGPQTDFLASTELQILYGGAAGGGKSYSLLADVLRYVDNKNFRGLLVRRTLSELTELIDKGSDLYWRTHKARFHKQGSYFTFPSGAVLHLSYLDDPEDLKKYQGQSYCWIGFDELTHWPTPKEWNYLSSRLRTTDPTLPLCQRATSNPGGLGHGWVKRMFIDPAPPNTTFVPTNIETGEQLRYSLKHHEVEKRGKPLFYRKFIPAKVIDNPYLWEDGRYEASLLALPEAERRQLLEGDWTIGEGAAFPEFRAAEPFVVKPFPIPPSWKRFRSCDYGYTTRSAVHWYAMDPVDNTIIVYRELYVTKKTGKELANMILALEINEKILYAILDSSVWHTRGQTGPTIAEEMNAEGARFRPADRSAGSRTSGKNRLHELLKLRVVGYNEDGSEKQRSGIVFFDTCRQIISDLPVIPVHPDGKDDIDDRYASDHAYDSIRYGIMSRPRGNDPMDWGNSIGSTVSSYRPTDAVFGY